MHRLHVYIGEFDLIIMSHSGFQIEYHELADFATLKCKESCGFQTLCSFVDFNFNLVYHVIFSRLFKQKRKKSVELVKLSIAVTLAFENLLCIFLLIF